MALSIAFDNSQAVDTTEWSMPRDASYDSGQTQTTLGVYQLLLDVSDMVTGDDLQIRVYEKVQSGGTQRIAYQANLVGPQSPPIFVLPSLILGIGWDMTLDAISGTITVGWSIRKSA